MTNTLNTTLPPRSEGMPGCTVDDVTAGTGLVVNELAIQVYEHTLANGWVTVAEVAAALRLPVFRIEQAMDTLRTLRLVKFCEVDGRCRAVSPDAAQVELIVPLEEAIHNKRRELAGIHEQLRSFADTFSTLNSSQLRRDVVVSYQEADQEQVELRMADAARKCTSEILAMQPLGLCEEEELRPFGLKALPNGVRMRVLYPHTARTSSVTRGSLRKIAETGARIRTSNQIFDRLLIVGDEAAFMPDHSAGKDTQAVTIIYEPTVIALLRRVYEFAWQSGTDFDEDGVSYGETLGDVRSTILGLLASGLKDDVVARRIGMSSRTFRRHIASIMAELNAESRFQAGVAAARAGLVGLL